MLRTTRHEWIQHAALAAGLALLVIVMSGAAAASRAGSRDFIRLDEQLSPDLCPLEWEHAAVALGGLERRARRCALGYLELSRNESSGAAPLEHASRCREVEPPDAEAPLRQVMHELGDTGLRVMPALGYARMLAHPAGMTDAPAPAARLSRVSLAARRCH